MLKKKQQEQAANSLKTPEQLKFESHWSAGPSQEKSPQQQPQPSTSRAIPITQMSQRNDNYDDVQEDSKGGANFDCVKPPAFSNLMQPRTPRIPGLDYVTTMPINETFKNNNRVDPVFNLEEDDKIPETEEEYVPPKDPPPLPTFKSVVAKRVLVQIADILDVPGRNNRPER